MEKKFGIKVISNSCGILPHTLRVWEQRYQIFTPDRDSHGQRLYSEQDLNKAQLLAKLIQHGHSIGALANLGLEALQDLNTTLDRQEITNEKVSIQHLLNLLSHYAIDDVLKEIQHLRLSMGAKEFIFEVVLPTMSEIGKLVALGNYSVTQEHIISTIIRDQLGQIYLPNLGSKNREMVLATPEGNLHELSIIMADIICRANRMPTRFLGAAHPAECLGEAINALKSPFLVLGVVSSDHWNYQQNIVKYLSKLDRYLKHDITVLLGGGQSCKELDQQNFVHIHYKVIGTFLEFDQFLRAMP